MLSDTVSDKMYIFRFIFNNTFGNQIYKIITQIRSTNSY